MASVCSVSFHRMVPFQRYVTDPPSRSARSCAVRTSVAFSVAPATPAVVEVAGAVSTVRVAGTVPSSSVLESHAAAARSHHEDGEEEDDDSHKFSHFDIL